MRTLKKLRKTLPMGNSRKKHKPNSSRNGKICVIVDQTQSFVKVSEIKALKTAKNNILIRSAFKSRLTTLPC